jgi:21S rRNA (GM2251-2'-O)-methyltransferase
VAVRHASKHDLNMLSGNRPHQGLILDCSPLDWVALDRMPDHGSPGEGGDPADGDEGSPDGEGEGAGAGGGVAGGRYPVWLALDEVMDPVSGGG